MEVILVPTNKRIAEAAGRLEEAMKRYEMKLASEAPIECMLRGDDDLTLWFHRVKRDWMISASIVPNPSPENDPGVWIPWTASLSLSQKVRAVMMAADFPAAMEEERQNLLEDLNSAVDVMINLTEGRNR